MRFIIFLAFLISFNHLQAQEVICNVRVLSNQIQSSDKQKFSTLQKAIREFEIIKNGLQRCLSLKNA